MQPINDNTFIQLAMKFYDNPQCISVDEFQNDIKLFMYINKLLDRYDNSIHSRLLLNHIITVCNLFGIIAPDFLFFKTDKHHWNKLATFLVYLDKMPQSIPEFDVYLSNIELDESILKTLRNI